MFETDPALQGPESFSPAIYFKLHVITNLAAEILASISSKKTGRRGAEEGHPW
jgi:hypothetical protein